MHEYINSGGESSVVLATGGRYGWSLIKLFLWGKN